MGDGEVTTAVDDGAAGGHAARDLDAAVVVVNFRSSELVERCLASVRASSGGLRLETVIVDNASGDGSLERLRSSVPDATVVPMAENNGFAAGVNAGFTNTKADVVIVLNPDTEVRPGTLPALLARLDEHPHAGVVAPLLEGPDGHLTANAYERFPTLSSICLGLCLPLLYALERIPSLHPDMRSMAAVSAGRQPDWVCGAAMAIRRDAYEQAGPLDESFFLYFEETEWQSRVAQRGWTIEVAPQARAVHLVRGGGREALAPSPHFVASAVRYLRMRGVPRVVARAALAVSIVMSVLTLRLIALLPAKRARASWQASAYTSLLRELR